MRLDVALERAVRDRRSICVPYLMVDRARRRALAARVAALADAGATALELGYPFSDPIADGPVLASAAAAALDHGTRWSDLGEAVRIASRVLPTAVMTYANPVWQHGIDRALAGLAQDGATGLIVPDLSLEEAAPWARSARRRGLSLVLLAAPGGSPARVEQIARSTRGFLYVVSRYGTTGTGSPAALDELATIVAHAHRAVPRRPVLVGFGVRDRASADRARRSGADGVIVGSALEERIARGDAPGLLGRWLRTVRAEPRNRLPVDDPAAANPL